MSDVSATSVNQAAQPSSAAGNALSQITEDFDQFLTLLTTQLQYQDPTDPMDSNEMTAQLVQFASVEQQISQNRNLEAMLELMNASSSAAAVSYIGKDVQVAGDITHYDGAPIAFGYELPEESVGTTVSILDTDGKVVREFDGATSAQRHEIQWDGLDADGSEVPAGLYMFVVSARNSADKTIPAATDISGRVTGAAFNDSQPTLLIGEAEYALSEVQTVSDRPNTA